eukprot:TRINITY_DN10808_c0_g1_i1.p1 TRINITY_DN10808_c0_g1~~TRINITY_DN10808_c0_g1_i1.p1  ORF type:complete len:237 (-),score=92.90 TRINITY_DN10808_c0_g1_i1:84-794(-)
MTDVETTTAATTPTTKLTLSDAEKKLRELKQRLNTSRVLNKKDVIEEDRRNKNLNSGSKRKLELEEEDRKRREEEQQKNTGVNPEKEKNLNVTALDAEWMEERKKKKKGKAPLANPHDPIMHYRTYKKRTTELEKTMSKAEYEKAKEEEKKDFYRDADNLKYGESKVSAAAANRMVKELDERAAKRAQYSRRRTHYEEADVDYINERNRKYNDKISRAFDKYTGEIKQNLERGTAV